MIQFFQQTKPRDASNFYTHVGNVSLRSSIVNNTNKFIRGVIKCRFTVFTSFNPIVQDHLHSKSSELFCNVCGFFQSLTADKLFEDRVPDKPSNGQTAADSPWGYTGTN